MLSRTSLEEAAQAAEAIHAETGFWPALDDSRLRAHEFAAWEAWDGPELLDELIDLQRGNEPALRAVIGATLWFMRFDELEHERRRVAADAFDRLLSTRAIQSISDPLLLRWELHAAGAGQHLGRILEIGRRFDDLHCSPELLTQVATAAFLVIHPSIDSKSLLPSVFDPDIHSANWAIAEPWDLLVYSFATIVEARPSLDWTDPSAFGAKVLDALLQVDTLLQRTALTAPHSPTQQAIKHWCAFALGAATKDSDRLVSAARGYSTLPPHTSPLAVSMAEAAHRRPDTGAWAAAAACYGRAAKWASAIDAAETWCEADPQDPQAHRKLAEALYKDGRIPDAIEAFEKYVQHRREGENDWELSLLLQLGLLFKDSRQQAAALEMAALETTFRPQGEALVGWHFAWFPQLTRKARERWWIGLFTVSSPHVGAEIGDARWDQAADCFGEAVAFELKERVFRPFAVSHEQLVPPDRHWKGVLAGRGMLGEMIEILLQARSGNTEAARQLGKWLLETCPGLYGHIDTPRHQRLLTFARLRGQAQHDSIDESQARLVFTEAVELLRAMVGPPSKAASSGSVGR